jgi:hypothetical protein
MPEDRILKLVRNWIPSDKRKRGRPRKTWMEGVQAAMTIRDLKRNHLKKQGEMAFGFLKTATAVQLLQNSIDRYIINIKK